MKKVVSKTSCIGDEVAQGLADAIAIRGHARVAD
jgi:hypothetical protein